MNRKITLPAVAAYGLLTFAASLNAQTYSVDWYKIAGGGGLSTNATYSINGTIGQTDAGGAMSGGGYYVTGGYWSLVSVIQLPNVPPLRITPSGTSLVVSWANTGNYFLQQNSNITVTNGWATTSFTITTNIASNSITIPSPSGKLFFRLKAP